MKTPLRPCVRCDRHVRGDELSCPFCGAACVPSGLGASNGSARGALLVAGAVLALGAQDLAAPVCVLAQDDDPEEAIRLTPQYGAPDYQPDPPPPPPPPPPPRSPNERDAGPPRPPAPTSALSPDHDVPPGAGTRIS